MVSRLLEVCGDYMGGNTVCFLNMDREFMVQNKMFLKVVLYSQIVNDISAQLSQVKL